jgi:hypothetical protein
MPCSVISITLKIATSSLEIQYYSVMHQDAIDMKDYNTSESNQNKMVRSHSVYFIIRFLLSIICIVSGSDQKKNWTIMGGNCIWNYGLCSSLIDVFF